MKRKILLLIVLMLVMPFTVMAAETPITAQSTGYTDVLFSNGYRGYCLDRDLKGAYSGDSFTATGSTALATDNLTTADISQPLKILFTQHFEEIFTSDGNGGYQIADTNLIQAVVWHYTENQYVWGDQAALVNAIAAYTGPAIPDNGYTITLTNGDRITFSFMVIAPSTDAQQHFFAYNFSVTSAGSHVHDFGETWESDGAQHWLECDCGEKKDVDGHEETVINQKAASAFEAGYTGDTVCSICSALLEAGQTIPATHVHDFGEDWESDGSQHWLECDCGEKKDVDGHEETVINQKAAAEFEEGYTGDTVCSICSALLEAGQTIPATHVHDFGEDWESDGAQHWLECDCGEKKDVDGHEETVINQKAAAEFEEGYTGDTVCSICSALLEAGQTIPATHVHDFGETWESDGAQHWQECNCGEKDALANHLYKDGYCTTCKYYNPNYKSDSPNTGDGFTPAVFFAVGLISMTGLVFLLRKKREIV